MTGKYMFKKIFKFCTISIKSSNNWNLKYIMNLKKNLFISYTEIYNWKSLLKHRHLFINIFFLKYHILVDWGTYFYINIVLMALGNAIQNCSQTLKQMYLRTKNQNNKAKKSSK